MGLLWQLRSPGYGDEGYLTLLIQNTGIKWVEKLKWKSLNRSVWHITCLYKGHYSLGFIIWWRAFSLDWKRHTGHPTNCHQWSHSSTAAKKCKHHPAVLSTWTRRQSVVCCPRLNTAVVPNKETDMMIYRGTAEERQGGSKTPHFPFSGRWRSEEEEVVSKGVQERRQEQK